MEREQVNDVRWLAIAFTFTSFLGAFLLFAVEPMVARMLLPSLGGSAAVWNTAVVFFQVSLLLGYLYAHLSLRWLRPRLQASIQILLLVLTLFALPIAVPGAWSPPAGSDPVGWTLLALVVMVAAPFAMLATTGPTLQRWFSLTTHPRASDPYFLYAAGNAGSLLALLSYPLVIEPALSLSRQSRMWAVLYASFVVATAVCAVLMLRLRSAVPTERDRSMVHVASRPDRRRRIRWVCFALLPAALLLGVTRHLSTDVGSIPMLWILPLALYLLTFIVAFGRDADRVARRAGRVLTILAIPIGLTFIGIIPSLWVQLPLQLAGFTAAALVAHARLAADRPPPAFLTGYFLLIALGGALGGIAAGLGAPLLLPGVYEYPIAFVLTIAIIPPAAVDRDGVWSRRRSVAVAIIAAIAGIAAVAVRSDGSQRSLTLAMIVAASGLLVAFSLARKPAGFATAVGIVLLLATLVPPNETLFSERTFFGVHRVYVDASGKHILLNGTTVHGVQNGPGEAQVIPLAYYSVDGPVGDVFSHVLRGGHRSVAVIGAGAGSVAAYLRSGDDLTFFEIDEAVERIATDPSLFTFVRDSKGTVRFVLGDGRLELSRIDRDYDVVVVDAFSGDAIPAHLLTLEALRLYVDRTTEDGIVSFNISNRYFDLRPVLGRLASEAHLVAMVRTDPATSEGRAESGALASTWVVMAREVADLGDLASEGWEPLDATREAPMWTDDYTNLFATLRLGS